jgi:aspartate racemase
MKRESELMKTIGLLGGMSWESTINYYRIINEEVKNKLGGLNSAKICMYSVNFEEVEKFMRIGDWKTVGEKLSIAAAKIENGGADFLLICTNTMHIVAPEIEKNISIPILHIADATADEIKKNKIESIGLIGTKPTMEEDFYKKRLEKKHGINVLIPNESDRQIVHDVIFKELCLGKINTDSKKEYIRIIHNLEEQGAQGIILGCTEIILLVQPNDISVPVFDTTEIHAKAAVGKGLG